MMPQAVLGVGVQAQGDLVNAGAFQLAQVAGNAVDVRGVADQREVLDQLRHHGFRHAFDVRRFFQERLEEGRLARPRPWPPSAGRGKSP